MIVFFFNDTATTEIYTLSLHDALPISERCGGAAGDAVGRGKGAEQHDQPDREDLRRRGDHEAGGGQPPGGRGDLHRGAVAGDRKSTRLNSSHANISYAVFCLKKKKITR